MKKNEIRKCLVLGIIILFFGASIVPSFSGNETKQESTGALNGSSKISGIDPAVSQDITSQEEFDQPDNDNTQEIIKINDGVDWIPFIPEADPGTPPSVKMKGSDNSGIFIDSDIYGMYCINITIENETYQHLKIPDEGHTTEVGQPKIPIVKRYIEVPYYVDLTVSIFYSSYSTWDGFNVIPAQEPQNDSLDMQSNEKQEFVIDDRIYSADEWYPSCEASIEEPVIMRGHRIVSITLYPVQFNPATQQIRGYDKIEVWVNYRSPAQIEGIEERLESESFENLAEAFILNYRSPNRYAIRRDGPPDKSPGADYLIITNDAFYNQVKPLAKWKQLKGYETKIVNTSDISSPTPPTADQIRTYIQNAYDTWDPSPTYLLLVGDSDYLPTNYGTKHPYHNNQRTATDINYSTVHGTDYFPDIFIGRISVDTTAQATIIVNKIINYEKNPPTDASFYSNVSVCAFFQDRDKWSSTYGWITRKDGYEDRRFVLTSEEIRDYLLTQGYTVWRIYCKDSGSTPTNYSPAPGDYFSYDLGLPLPPDINETSGFAWDGSTADITTNITAGRFIINHRDHGGSQNWGGGGTCEGWGHPWYTTTEVAGLSNGNKLPVVFSINCMTGWFDGETDPYATRNYECLCEEFLRKQNGGAVAAFGATRISFSGWNDQLARGFYDAIWPNFDTSIQTGAMYNLGMVLTYGKMYMATKYVDSDYRRIEFEEFHLFGDPEMSIWTSKPKSLTVTYPSSIGSGGSQKFVVNVTDGVNPVYEALVCLYKEGDVHTTKYTDPGGHVIFDITPSTGGNLNVTVTKHNYKPYEGSITVTSNGATISLSPDSGSPGASFTITGNGFSGSETVKIYFGGSLLGTAPCSGGIFSKGFNVPSAPPDPTNVVAIGQSSGRAAVAVFRVLPTVPLPDPYIYDQWCSSTWHLNPSGGNPTWNNPVIKLYDKNTGNLVNSGNLRVGTTYWVNATIHNYGPGNAPGTIVTFKWANLGTGQPDLLWFLIGSDTLSVPASGTAVASVLWTPIQTGHCCVSVKVYHAQDSDTKNNHGWENCQIYNTLSPTTIIFDVSNPTNNTALVYLELVQKGGGGKDGHEDLWGTYIERDFPQTLEPGQSQPARFSLDAPGWVDHGESRTFTITAYIDGEIVGGVEFPVVKDHPPVIPSNPSPGFGASGVSISAHLSWTGGDINPTDMVTYEVYFGTEPDPPYVETIGPYSAMEMYIWYDPGTLEYETTYYWKIVATDDYEISEESQIWSFETCDHPGGIIREHNLGLITADPRCLGVEFDGFNYWVTGAGNFDVANLYKIAPDGTLLETYHQPYENWGTWGWRDLVWDGEYLYAGDDAAAHEHITQINPATGEPTGVYYGPFPIDPCRALAYDPSADAFWTASFGSQIYKCYRDNSYEEYDNPGLSIYGMAMGDSDPSEPMLWIWSQDGNGCLASEFDPMTGQLTGVTFDGDPGIGGIAGGACAYDNGIWEFVGLHQVDPDDHMVAYALAPGNNPPNIPSDPNPSDGANEIWVETTLSWTGGDPDPGDTVTYDVYFGTTNPPPKVIGNQSQPHYTPPTLDYQTTYYWQIVSWDRQDASTTGPIWQFVTSGPNNPPDIPSDPDPYDGETGVSITQDLSWTGGDPDPGDPLTYNVYFGTTSPPPQVEWNQSETTYDPGTMQYDTKYYWQIIAWDSRGSFTEGPIWEFTTELSNYPPYTPSDPDPEDGETDVSINADLSWSGGDPDPGDTVTYDVYFGTSSIPPQVEWNQTQTTYDPGTLDYETTYYWKIVAWDNHGASTPGPVWDFTTEEPPNNPPDTPEIDGETEGKIGEEYEYTFYTTDPNDDDISFYVEWGDDTHTDWTDFVASGTEVTLTHTWEEQGAYNITAKAKDIHEAESGWGYLEVEMPLELQFPDEQSSQLLERFITHNTLLGQTFLSHLFFS